MGSEDGTSWEKPAHAVRVGAFEIGVRPVSNAQYKEFRPSHSSPGDDSADAPVTGVSWRDAKAYCEWLGQRLGKTIELPTEARWERAVRGGLEQRKYPWGHDPADTVALANPYGVYAVASNLWEWTSDWYADDYFSESPAEDPKGPAEGQHRVLRGGGFFGQPDTATCYSRGSARPETRSERITFRVSLSDGAREYTQLSEVRPAPEAPRPEPKPVPAPEPQQTAAAPAPTPTKPSPILTLGESVTRVAPRKASPRPASEPVEKKTVETAAVPTTTAAISKIEVVDDGTGLAVALSTEGEVAVKAFRLDGPPRLVMDLPQCQLRGIPLVGEIKVGRRGVVKLRYSQRTLDPPSVRVVADLQSAVDYRVEASGGRTLIKLTTR